jgi:hypothetical protein
MQQNAKINKIRYGRLIRRPLKLSKFVGYIVNYVSLPVEVTKLQYQLMSTSIFSVSHPFQYHHYIVFIMKTVSIVNKWSDVKCSDVGWTDVIYVRWFYFKVKWSDWSEVSCGEVLVDKGPMYIRVTLYCGHLIILWLFHLGVFCTVFVLICTVLVLYYFVMCVFVCVCVCLYVWVL